MAVLALVIIRQVLWQHGSAMPRSKYAGSHPPDTRPTFANSDSACLTKLGVLEGSWDLVSRLYLGF